MTIEDVEKLAELSRIELSEEEKLGLLSDMEGILAYVQQIQDINVPNIEPNYKHRNIWREDVLVNGDFSREIIVGQFPDSQDGFVKVKKIL